jgi:purine-nucleoside phosphorylase
MSEQESSDLTKAAQAADWLRAKWGITEVDRSYVMGSGWGKAADLLGKTLHEVDKDEVPGFLAPAVAGHHGKLRLVDQNSSLALVQLGRTHLYEGHGVAPVVHGVRTAGALGAKTLILTNAAGGLKSTWQVGQPVLIRDHINLTATSPLTGPEFIDMTETYSPTLREACKRYDSSLDEGVYTQFRGPQYETPAEIEMVRRLGGDLVGMSTVLEAIAAKALNIEILGISLVTNLAAGMTGEPLSHKEVLAAGEAAADRMGRLLANVVS